jgi:hypothetical protein
MGILRLKWGKAKPFCYHGQMKVAVYNVASGGFNTYDSTADTPERLELLKEAVAAIDADIIGLTDTFRWAEVFTASQLQDTFNYPLVASLNLG